MDIVIIAIAVVAYFIYRKFLINKYPVFESVKIGRLIGVPLFYTAFIACCYFRQVGAADKILYGSFDQRWLSGTNAKWDAYVINEAYNQMDYDTKDLFGIAAFVEYIAMLMTIVVVISTVIAFIKMYDSSKIAKIKLGTTTLISLSACLLYWCLFGYRAIKTLSYAKKIGEDVESAQTLVYISWIVFTVALIWAYTYYKKKLEVYEIRLHLTTPMQNAKPQQTTINVHNDQATKNCPYCGEEILAVAKKCKHCGEWIKEETMPKPVKMVACPVCGENVEEGISVCPHCKENISEPIQHQEQESAIEKSPIVEEKKEESKPAGEQKLLCPFCNEEIESGTTVCPYCEEPLE